MPEIEGAHGAELRLSRSERRGQRCVLRQVNRRASNVAQKLLEHSPSVMGLKFIMRCQEN